MKKTISVFIAVALVLSAYSIGYAHGGKNRLVRLTTKANRILNRIYGPENSRIEYFPGSENGSIIAPHIVQSVALGDDGDFATRVELYHRKTDDDEQPVCHLIAAIEFGADGEDLQIFASPEYPPDPIIPSDSVYPPDPVCVALESDVPF